MSNEEQTDMFKAENLVAAQELTELSWQYRASRVLLAAHQLGIFEELRQPKTAAEVANEKTIDAEMTEKLLIATCALGLVQRDGGRFRLTQLAGDVLLPEGACYIGGVLDHGESLWWTWSGLTDLLRGGELSAARRELMAQLARTAHYVNDYDEHFIWAMHGKAANGGAQFLATHVDLNKRKLLLDVGGGPGTYSIALCQRFPRLKAVVWDMPHTLKICRQVVQRCGLTDRIGVQMGDWETDDFGEGYDALLLSNVTHGPGSKAKMKLAKAFRSLEPGGLLIVNDFLLNKDKTGPLPAALFNLMIGAYSEEEMLAIVREAGFTKVSLVTRDPMVGSGIVTALRP